jgi:hypothetical protein
MEQRFATEFGLSPYDAATLTASREMAAYFEAALARAGRENAKPVANWVMGELSARLNKEGLELSAAPLSAQQLAGIVRRIADNTISNKIAKDVFEALWAGEGKDADAVIEAKGWKQITDTGAIEALVDEVLAANQKSVEEYRAGKEKAFNALVGQAMKATKGKANPQQVTDLLKKKARRLITSFLPASARSGVAGATAGAGAAAGASGLACRWPEPVGRAVSRFLARQFEIALSFLGESVADIFHVFDPAIHRRLLRLDLLFVFADLRLERIRHGLPL